VKIYLSLLICVLIIFTSIKTNAQSDTNSKFSFTMYPLMDKIITKEKIAKNTAKVDIATKKNDNIEKFPMMTMEGMPCYTLSYLRGDTISLLIMPMFTPGKGVVTIQFFKDTAVAINAEAPKDGEPRYKNTETDKSFEKSIVVNPKLCRITLAQKPAANGAIVGFIEYESKDYFVKNGKSLDKKSFKMKGFFNSIYK
jgi:hypothetical protein